MHANAELLELKASFLILRFFLLKEAMEEVRRQMADLAK